MTPERRREMVQRLAYALRLTLSHDEESAALRARLLELEQSFSAGGALELTVDEEDVFVNGAPVTFEDEFEGTEYASMIRELFDTLGIARLVFTEAVDEEELTEFMRCVRQDYRAPMPEGFGARRFTRIVVEPQPGLRVRTRKTVASWLGLLHDVRGLRDLLGRDAETAALAAVVRRLHRLADGGPSQEPVRIALALRPSTDPIEHAGSSAVLAMIAGSCAGASREALSRLGIAGVLHALATGHDRRSTAAALGASLRFDATDKRAAGAPLLPCTDPLPDAAAGLLAGVCEFHQALADSGSDRVWHRLAQGADERRLLVTRLLAKALGTFPPGSAVRLTSGESGVVIRPPRDASAPDRPVVRVLRARDGAEIDALVDLGAPGEAAHSIAGSIAASAAGFEPVQEFLSAWTSRSRA